jgi:hypothetical protein
MLLGLAATPILTGHSQAQELMIGDIDADGRTTLLYEQLEGVYGNAWSGMRVSGDGYGQTDVHIRGEGKTAMFDGILSINCEDPAGSYWLTNDEATNNTVPLHAIVNARRFFCNEQ